MFSIITKLVFSKKKNCTFQYWISGLVSRTSMDVFNNYLVGLQQLPIESIPPIKSILLDRWRATYRVSQWLLEFAGVYYSYFFFLTFSFVNCTAINYAAINYAAINYAAVTLLFFWFLLTLAISEIISRYPFFT